MGRSGGDLSSKLHVAAGAIGLPIQIMVAAGHRGYVLFPGDTIAGSKSDHVIVDSGYYANHLRLAIAYQSELAVISSRPDRTKRLPSSSCLYRECNFVERLINRPKQFRRIATRSDRLTDDYRGFVLIAAICLWLAYAFNFGGFLSIAPAPHRDAAAGP